MLFLFCLQQGRDFSEMKIQLNVLHIHTTDLTFWFLSVLYFL